MKVFRICNSSELPSYQDREDNYIYFTYDTLNIYIGKSSQYNGYYAIVENLPEIGEQDKPVEVMYYITMDGNVNVYHNETEDWEVIAEIEDSSQTEYLTKAGTTFLMKAGYKYIDFQRKVLCLPYQHGEFQLSVMLDKPIIIDDSTIIVYNPETGKFEIDGLRYYDEYGRNPEIMKYVGIRTNTVDTYIQNDHIHADVRISPKAGNIIESRTDGLYVSKNKYATSEEFEDLVTRTQAEMSAYTAFMEEIAETMRHVDITLSDQTLEEMIEGMADYEYVIEILSTPVYMDTLEAWQRRSQKDMTDWNSHLQGTTSLSFNLSIPMMYMANASQSQGWSKAYTDANTVSTAQGESFSTSE